MISLITATFNSAETLPALIASVRAQSDRSAEWIVVDGGSSDGTLALLHEAGDVVTRWISEPDFGVYHALNKGLLLARGTYYLVVGSDDTLEWNAIESFGAVARTTDADVIAAAVRIDGAVVHPRRRLAWIRSGPPGVAAHSVGSLIRRSLHDEFGLYSKHYPIAADTFFLLQALTRGKRCAYVERVAGTFGTAGTSSTDTLGALCESWRANVAVRGRYWLQLPLFMLRLLVNGPRIARRLGKRPTQ